MRRVRLACCRWFVAIAGAACLLLMSALVLSQTVEPLTQQAPANLATVAQAEATLAPDGQAIVRRATRLPHRWDDDFSGYNGSATYTMRLPVLSGGGPYGLYLSRVGNQATVAINGVVLAVLGAPNDIGFDATKTPTWIPVASTLVANDGTDQLTVTIAAQSGRWGGLAQPVWGQEALVYPMYRSHYVSRIYVALAIICILLSVGMIAGALWWLQRDPWFGWFALAAAFGALRFVDVVAPELPLSWPLRGGVMACALQIHTLCLVRFFLNILRFDRPWLNRATAWLMLAYVFLAMVAFFRHLPILWTITLLANLPIGVVVIFVLAQHALRYREPSTVLIAVTMAAIIVATIHDVWIVRVLGEGPGMVFWSPAITLLFAVVTGALIVQRFAQQVSANQALLLSLDSRVKQREAELAASHAQTREQEAERAKLLERQRITQEIHDGVGAHLVGLVAMIRSGDTAQHTLSEHANAALDELRMAVDSMQPTHRDLTTVLATLRHRMQPKLDACRIRLEWVIGDLPEPDGLSPTIRAQFQRILLEALSNAMRHSGASDMRVQTSYVAEPTPYYEMDIADNGKGLPTLPSAHAGHGIANMHARAQAMGASLHITPSQMGGVRLTLRLTLENMHVAGLQGRGTATR